MQVATTRLPGVLLLQTQVFEDARGSTSETFNQRAFAAATGLDCTFVQDVCSVSRKGVLRGLHYQTAQSQAKLVRVARGQVFDVAVDLRPASPTLGQWTGQLLSAQEGLQIWIPAGFAHGFLVLSDSAEVHYKTSDFYAPEHSRSMAWNDPQLGIDWPLQALGSTPVLLSDQDARAVAFAQAELPA